MIKIDPVANSETGYNVTLDSQFIKRMELMEQVKNRIGKVGENQSSDTERKYQIKEEFSSKDNSRKDTAENLFSKPEKEFILPEGNKLSFIVSDTGRVIIRLTDPKTGEIVREIPPEEMIEKMSKIVSSNNKNTNVILDKKV